MSGKNQLPVTFNWQSTNPVTGFLPAALPTGSTPSGVVAGAMASTNVIYSQIIDVSVMDNIGLELTWSGTPVGVFEVQVSNSGAHFYSLTFDPVLTQPAGSAGGYVVNIEQQAFKYIMLKYANTSGSGSLFVYGEFKSLS